MSTTAGLLAASEHLAAADMATSNRSVNPSEHQKHGCVAPALPSNGPEVYADQQAACLLHHEQGHGVAPGSSIRRPPPDPHNGNPHPPRSTAS